MKKYITHFLIKIFSITALFFTADNLDAQPIGVQSFHVLQNNNAVKINRILLSKNGWIWVGTQNGLYSFDGIEFTNINTADTTPILAVTALYEDKNGKPWIGTSNGKIFFIENKLLHLYNPEEGLPKASINDFAEDEQGRLWFATGGEGVYCMYKNRLYNVNTDDGLSDDYVYDLEKASEGIYVTTDQGINNCSYQNEKKRIQKLNFSQALPDNIVRCMYPLPNNLFLAGFQDKGFTVMRKVNEQYSVEYITTNWQGGAINQFCTVDENKIWAATDKALCMIEIKINNDQTISVRYETNETITNTKQVITDNEGNCWLAQSTELIKSTGARLTLMKALTENDFKKIHTLVYDSHGEIWTTGNQGIIRYPIINNRFEKPNQFYLKEIDDKTAITSIYEDKYHMLWIGTFGKGVYVLNQQNGNYRCITEDRFLKNAAILHITGKGDAVWIATLGGAVKCTLTNLNADYKNIYQFRNYSDAAEIGINYIYQTFIDSKNRVWFATDGKGITVLENDQFKNYNEKDSIADEVVYSITEDKYGTLWFATSSRGIYAFNGKNFTHYGMKEGLSDDNNTGLIADNNGAIFIAHKKGIDILDAATGSITYLDESYGISNMNTNLNCLTKDETGAIYFSTNNGIMCYKPQSRFKNKPMILLKEINLFLKPIGLSQTHFSYDQNNFTFYFSGIYFTNPQRLQYQYKMDGYSNEWITTKNTFAPFSQLPPGKYTFRVRVALNNNFKNAPEASFAFVIEVPFWRRWWFIALMIVFIVSIMFLIFKTRERQLKKWQQIKEEKIRFQLETLKSQVNPHFLFNSFNTLLSVIDDNPKLAMKYVEELSDFYRSIVNTREKDLVSLEEELSLVQHYFFIQKMRFGNSLSLNLNLNEADLKNIFIPPLTLQLLCENAIKHNTISKQTPLIVEVFKNGKLLVIKNNINVKLNKEEGERMGLQNIKKRYELLTHQPVEVVQTPQSFSVSLPLLEKK